MAELAHMRVVCVDTDCVMEAATAPSQDKVIGMNPGSLRCVQPFTGCASKAGDSQIAHRTVVALGRAWRGREDPVPIRFAFEDVPLRRGPQDI